MNNQEIMNKPLTAEEAKNLKFPCLLEVWDFKNRRGYCDIIDHITGKGRFVTNTGVEWHHAAVPSPEIAEAMRKQFGTQSEYPKRMLVWNDDESDAGPRIVLSDLGEKAKGRYIIVNQSSENEYQNGELFNWSYYSHAKPIPEPDQIAQEIAQLRQRLADLEAKHNQQSRYLEIITQQINGIKTQIK
jgi:hypothetical protein